LNKRSGRPRLKACDAQNMGHNRPHAVGFPIRRRLHPDAVPPCAAPQTMQPDKAYPVEAAKH
jgi:hypothetical protein